MATEIDAIVNAAIPYGYIRNQEKNTFDVDEETAPVVVRIFEQ